tara:strand:- start:501 stop:950 length:450 start_codon:yes stop_codon:yes gene_type:complete
MNCIQLYDEMRKIYSRDKINVFFFADPLRNHDEFPDVQFIYSFGKPCPPFKPNAIDIQFAEPFAGPFYKLNIDGLCVDPELYDDWSRVRAIVCLPNGNLTCSWFFSIKDSADGIKEVLGYLCDNRWYSTDKSNVPWRFELNGELVQACI